MRSSENKPVADDKKTTNSKPTPHIPLPFKEVIADVLKVKPPEKLAKIKRSPKLP
jgi:hypothetical protein